MKRKRGSPKLAETETAALAPVCDVITSVSPSSAAPDSETVVMDFDDENSPPHHGYAPECVLDIDTLHFMKHLPPLPSDQFRRPFALPPKTRRSHTRTLILDLDETLVHSSTEPVQNPDHVMTVTSNGQVFEVQVKVRPHIEKFLSTVAQWFEVVVFTASQRVYAEPLLDILDPGKKFIKYRCYREACIEIDGTFLKDITTLGRDLETTMIVDNSIYAFAYQLDNGIPISSWFDDPNDRELLELLPLLADLARVGDVRPYLRKRFRLREVLLTDIA